MGVGALWQGYLQLQARKLARSFRGIGITSRSLFAVEILLDTSPTIEKRAAIMYGLIMTTNFEGQLVISKGSFVSLKVPTEIVENYSSDLQRELGGYRDRLVANRDARSGVGSYHTTAIKPREFRDLTRAQGKLDLPLGNFRVQVLGLGTASDGSSRTWYLVADCYELNQWRRSLGLPYHDFHITLAFEAGGDVHNQPKGVGTLL